MKKYILKFFKISLKTPPPPHFKSLGDFSPGAFYSTPSKSSHKRVSAQKTNI